MLRKKCIFVTILILLLILFAWIDEQYHELEKGLIGENVVVLHDDVIQLTKGSETIQIAGLDDPDFTDRDTYIQESMVQTKIGNLSLLYAFC